MIVNRKLEIILSRGIRSCYEDAVTSPVKTGARNVPRKSLFLIFNPLVFSKLICYNNIRLIQEKGLPLATINAQN